MKVEFNPENHTYTFNGNVVPHVTEIIENAGISDFSKIPINIRESAQDFGKNVHYACELWDRNDLDVNSLSDPLLPYLESWKKFLSDFSAEIIEIEKIVYSKKLNFAGTLDRVIKIKNKLYIIDIKTGKLYPSTSIQTAAYEVAYSEEVKTKVDIRMAVRLFDTGYEVKKYDDPMDRIYFISALNLYTWKRKNKK